MARRSARARPDRERVLCPACGSPIRVRYENRRTLVTLSGAVRVRLKIRRCEQAGCVRHHRPYRPEEEGAIALPQHEFGLDVVALVGALRYREHRSVPEIHAALRGREVEITERSVTNLLDRYDELLATTLAGSERLRGVLAGQGRAILALDGLQPDVGHEVLWVVGGCVAFRGKAGPCRPAAAVSLQFRQFLDETGDALLQSLRLERFGRIQRGQPRFQNLAFALERGEIARAQHGRAELRRTPWARPARPGRCAA